MDYFPWEIVISSIPPPLLSTVLCLGMCPLAGCGKSHGWGVSGTHESNCWVEQLRCDGRIFAVLVANGGSKGMSSGEGDGSFSGKLLALDGRRISWSCEMRDAPRGTLTIDGQEFDLAAGNVFLVRMTEPKVSVEQVVVDPSKLQASLGSQLQSLQSTEPQIRTFLVESQGRP